MPKSVGDIGLPMVAHPHDPESAWVFPMDGTDVWPRVSPGGKPAAYRTRDGGKTWKRQADGMPKSQAWWTVKRQAMTVDAFSIAGRVLRHDVGRGVGQPRRRPQLEAPRRAPAGHLRGRGGVAAHSHVKRTSFASPSRRSCARTPEARRASRSRSRRDPPRLRDVFAGLDAAYPGIRFRMVDEAGRVRPHVQVFVAAKVQRDPSAVLKPGDEIMIVGALSGG